MKWLIFSYILYLIDNRTKREAEARLKVGSKPVPVAGGRLLLRRVSNKGMAGGFLPEKSEKVRMAATAAGAIIALSFLCEIPRKRRFFSKAQKEKIFLEGRIGSAYGGSGREPLRSLDERQCNGLSEYRRRGRKAFKGCLQSGGCHDFGRRDASYSHKIVRWR